MTVTYGRPMTLARGHALRILNGAGMVVAVLEGTAWITEQDSREDNLIQAGGSLRLRRPGVAIVQALGPSRVVLLAPERSGLARLWESLFRPASRPTSAAL